MKERIAIGYKFIVCNTSVRVPNALLKDFKDEFRSKADEIPIELTLQMGRYA